MRYTKNILIFLLSILCLSLDSSCKEEKASPDLATLQLLRGDLQFCGDGKFGEVSFSESCSFQTRDTFDLAISLLHSFEYIEAEKAFVKVIDSDPDCAMAYWGVAMSIYHGLWAPPQVAVLDKGNKLLTIAAGLSKTEKAAHYIEAISSFYKDWKTIGNQERKNSYAQKMQEMYKMYPDDTEVAIFYALALRASADPTDKTYSKQKVAGSLLEELFKTSPNHPGIAHYIIHSYDYPELAIMGLETARRYASIAPSSAHAQHMPSHIFTRLGYWNESIQTNINSAASAACYTESVASGEHSQEEIHAMGYLVYAYLQIGNTTKAREHYQRLLTFEKIYPINSAISYTSAAIPARIAMETRNWKEASQLNLPKIGGIHWANYPWERSLIHFTRALGKINMDQLPEAKKDLILLNNSHKQLVENKDGYKAEQVAIQIKMIEAWLALKSSNNEEAFALMTEASEMEALTSKHPVTPGEIVPADELLGNMLVQLDKPSEALAVYKRNLKKHPNRFNGIYGAAVAARNSGREEEALGYFKKLVSVAGDDTINERLELKEAQIFIKNSEIDYEL